MAEDRDEGRGFTVRDRRRFSPETGEARADVEEGGRAEANRQHEAEGARPDTGAASREHSPEGTPAAGARSETSGRAGQLLEITLSTFILSMSTQVLMHLGEISNPIGEKVERDMSAAKQVIDILGMLREKTKGNLDKSEETLFDNVLYDLRMRYVELLKSGTRQ